MPQEIYEIIALGARWWFILLGVLIVLRAFGWLRRDGRRAKRRLRQLPDAGMVGEMVVVIGNKELEAGMVMTVPREGTLGSYRSCDLVIPAEGVAPAHCDFSFVDGQGLLLYPRRRCPVKIDGEEFIRRLQSNVFSVQCLINAWYCEDLPWREFGCEDEVRELLKLRVRLMPRLQEAFRIYKETGKPPIRSLVMDYTSDPEVANIDNEYLFCEDLLVAPIAAGLGDTRQVYLPAGSWVDFFTEEPVAPGWHTVTTEGIPVYRKVSE